MTPAPALMANGQNDIAGGAAVLEAPPEFGNEDRSFLGHPRGLATLFFTEMWERFSYYGMRALLILFMTAAVADGGLGFDVATAGAIYGLYTGFVYLMALPGGWIADRVVGTRRAVLIGGIIIAAGHFSMAIHSMTTFYLGLVLIVCGTGLLKPNISAMVGDLYPEGGSRRDAGFSIFYMGINLGAFIAPLIVGFLGERVDWHLGFSAAGLGMVLGIIQYVAGGKYLGQAGLFVAEGKQKAKAQFAAGMGVLGSLVIIGLVLNRTGIFTPSATTMANAAGVLIAVICLLYFTTVFAAGGLDGTERKRIGAVFILFIFSAVFWSGFEQVGSSFNLVARDLTDRVVFGREAPASWFQSINSLFIISLAPVFAVIWVALGRRNKEPSSPLKFALGLVFLGAGFLVMVAATAIAAGGTRVSPMWLVLTLFLHTLGELCLSPVGLSTVTKLAPQRYVGQMMGVWFMSIALGNLMAGRVAGLFDTLPLPQLFGAVTATTAGAGVLLMLLVRPIRKLMVGVH